MQRKGLFFGIAAQSSFVGEFSRAPHDKGVYFSSNHTIVFANEEGCDLFTWGRSQHPLNLEGQVWMLLILAAYVFDFSRALKQFPST